MSRTFPSLQGLRILVVEDDFLVAETLSLIIEDAGAVIIGPIGWVDEALAFLRDSDLPLDAALLDVNLHGQFSYPVADALAARAVGFVFLTGYDGAALNGAYRDYPRCQKPFEPDAVLAAVAGVAA